MIDDPMPAADAGLLVESELRRRIKADAMARSNPPAKHISEPLDDALNRLAGLKPITRNHAPDPAPVQALIAAAEIPRRHLKRTDTSCAQWMTKLGELKQRLGTGFLCALCGPQGTGKTQMAVECIRANAALLKPSRFSTAMDFFIALKQSYDPEERSSERGIITQFSRPRLLVLDEMDERGETEWENRLLFHLLNRRYNDMKDTLVISRRSREECESALGKSIASRIQETGGFIVANWPSFRQ